MRSARVLATTVLLVYAGVVLCALPAPALAASAPAPATAGAAMTPPRSALRALSALGPRGWPGLGIPHGLFNGGKVGRSVPLGCPVLAYLLVGMLIAGFRPGASRQPLVPLLPVKLLVVGAIALFGARIALNAID